MSRPLVWPEDPERGQLMLTDREPDQQFRFGSPREAAQQAQPSRKTKSLTGRNARIARVLQTIAGSALTSVMSLG